MNEVRERILKSIKPYKDFWKHNDLIAFCVCGEYLSYCDDDGNEFEADFNELVVVAEKDWLFRLMQEDDIENPLEFLQSKYTSDDSIVWYDEAVEQGKIVMVDFN